MDTLKFISQKYKLNLATRSPIELPKMGRKDLSHLFSELGFTRGAEVGTWTGSYTSHLCSVNPNLKLIGVDLTSTTPKKSVPTNCKLLKSSSLEAAKRIVDGSLDFVYLDVDHNFTDTAVDISEWSKKVKKGGIIAGHDYFRYRSHTQIHTQEAVNAYTNAYRVAPWFVIGRNKDRVRSWFWVKV